MNPVLVAKRFLAVIYDLSALVVCWFLAYWLRFNLDIPGPFLAGGAEALLLVLAVHAPAYWLFGLYRGIWRYASLMDLRRIIVAVAVAAVGVGAAVFMFQKTSVPRSVLILHPILLVFAMGGGRFTYRAWRDRALYGRMMLVGEPVLVLGSGDGADRLLRELVFSPDWCVVGLFGSESRRVGHELHGVKVLGLIDDLPKWADKLSVRKAIVAMPEASQVRRRHAMEVAVQAGLSVLTVPSLDDMLSEKVSISQVRQVQLEDLLGREAVRLDNAGLRDWLGEHVVLVTGAGGSIGSELARQIAQFRPRLLVLFDISEFALYQVEQEFQRRFSALPIACVVGDVKDVESLERVFQTHRPSIVFHAAAYKHVPLMEGENAWQAVRNNVLGSKRLAEAAQRYGVEKMVLISTDKAVNPTNVMGATKRLAERVLGGMQQAGGTRFVTVRFGNVLGSNGSVIPKFREQIARGGPVTVTHPEIIRYFMLIPEAAQLVLQAGLMGQGGEIFVLEMGEPIRIADLARDMIRLSGFSEDEIRIEYTGLRPGEKLYEELLTDSERTLPTPHDKLRVAQAEAAPPADWRAELDHWLGQPAPASANELKRHLQRFVPEYAPQLQ
ncbi:polysaccharide biosynthesis protein [Propionivibrio limicola]|uniref:polysaccharide biosynthesis protein n=1 Tax=Propionivibrio limicola TaxID=167645 RepID=UPI0012909AA7|nr:nucleoside-diphosphate sugar epimerase/dehydratase [Propionivibrio limicola]